MAKVVVGEQAPNFVARGTGDREYTLSDYRGQPVVLVFYPGDATPVCTVQLRDYNNGISQFSELNAAVIGLSPQDIESHERWSAEENFAFPLIYDEEKKIGETYGVVGPLGFYRRSVFVINIEGVITYAKRNLNNARFVSTADLVEAVKASR